MAASDGHIAASRELIKEHYNQHVGEGVSTKEVSSSRGLPMMPSLCSRTSTFDTYSVVLGTCKKA
jgi:hypothetical protein